MTIEPPPPVTRQLAAFLAASSIGDLPPAAIAAAKAALLDLLGNALGAAGSAEATIAADFARDLGGRAEATVIGRDFRTNCRDAAFVNGLAAHVLELDDTHLQSLTHAGAPVIPAALAMAERTGVSGAAALAAIVLGYETCLRIAVAVQPSHWQAGFLTMGTCGAFGAAAAASHCLGLDAPRLAAAFGLAGMQAAGTNSSSYGQGDMGRRMSPAHGAAAGVTAALLASRGFTGSANILEGRNGFLHCFAPQADPADIVAGLGRDYLILRNGLKPYSCNRMHHSAIDALLTILARDGNAPDRIEQITVETFESALTGRPHRAVPQTLFDAKMSLPFCLAVAALRGGAGEREFDEGSIRDAKLQAFAGKVRLAADPQMSKVFPREWPARVTVRFTDGTTQDALVRYPTGEPEAPMTRAQREKKFIDLATQIVPETTAARIIAEVDGLDRAGDVSRLMSLVQASGA